jgi:hypothetical protein
VVNLCSVHGHNKRQRAGALQDLADSRRPRLSRSVLDCGSPLPLSFREPGFHHGGTEAQRSKTDRPLLPLCLRASVVIPCSVHGHSKRQRAGALQDLADSRRPGLTRSVLDCGSPLPLSFRELGFHHGGTEAQRSKTDRPLLPLCLRASVVIPCSVHGYSGRA